MVVDSVSDVVQLSGEQIRAVPEIGATIDRQFLTGIGTLDVNGQPRLMRRERWQEMDLQSRNWLLDPEMVVKAHYMGMRILELNVFARMRSNGISHVRASTCWEFFVHILRMRFSGDLREWREAHPAPGPLASGQVQTTG